MYATISPVLVRDWWDDEWLYNTVQTGGFVAAVAAFLAVGGVCGVAYRARRRRFLSFVLLSRRTRRRHFDERTPQIGYVVAITAAAGVFALEIALLALVRWAARWLLQYSQLVHSFVTEMIHVDLEDLDIKLDDGLRIVRDLATSLLYAGACGLLATAFAWVLAVQHVE